MFSGVWGAAWGASHSRRCSGEESLLAGAEPLPAAIATRVPIWNGGLHHRARVRRVIQLFMNGGVSQMDTFDYKPELDRRHGQTFDPGTHVEAPTSAPGKLMKSPFAFRQHGECGRWVSSVFPEIAACVDDLAFLVALSSKTNVHGPASFMMNYRLLDARISLHGGLAFLRPGLAARQPADVRGAAGSRRDCLTTPRETSRRDSCRSRIRG